MNVLQKELDEVQKEERLKNIETIKKELEEKERLLTFFDNEEQIELAIENKLEKEKLEMGDEAVSNEVSDELYVSPDIIKRKQNTN